MYRCIGDNYQESRAQAKGQRKSTTNGYLHVLVRAMDRPALPQRGRKSRPPNERSNVCFPTHAQLFELVAAWQNIYMVISRLFLYMELTPVVPIFCCMSFAWYLVCVMCRIKAVLCAGLRLCYVQASVCVMCWISSVLCAGFSQCHMRVVACVMFSR